MPLLQQISLLNNFILHKFLSKCNNPHTHQAKNFSLQTYQTLLFGNLIVDWDHYLKIAWNSLHNHFWKFMEVEDKFVNFNFKKFSKSLIQMIQQDFNNHQKLLLNCSLLWIKIHEIKESIKMIFYHYVEDIWIVRKSQLFIHQWLRRDCQ